MICHLDQASKAPADASVWRDQREAMRNKGKSLRVDPSTRPCVARPARDDRQRARLGVTVFFETGH